MLLREIFELLTYGELANTILGGDDTQSAIPADKYNQIIPAINAALDALHARFELRFNSVMIQQKDQVFTYVIDAKNAGTYLVSSENGTYSNDLIRIDRVVDSCGKNVFVNKEHECSSVILPTYNSVEFPTAKEGEIYNVIYQAKHPQILMTGADVLDQTVDLPANFLEAFMAYVGYRIYKNRKALNLESPSNNYYGIYQSECARLENKSPINIIDTADAVRSAGWV